MSARVPFAADSSPESPHLTPDSNATRTRADQARSPAQGRRTRSRKKTFTREDRAMHSLVERQRRGAFNRLLSQLASSIPDQASTKNLSKGVIVQASIEHHAVQRQRALTACVEIRRLLAERAELLREVNALRPASAPRTLERSQEEARSEDRRLVFSVETEHFVDIHLGSEEHDVPAHAPTAPSPNPISRLLEHIDDDFLSFAPHLQHLPAAL